MAYKPTFSGFFSLFFTFSLSCYIIKDSDIAYLTTAYSNDGQYSKLATNGNPQQCHVKPGKMARPLYYVDLESTRMASEICVKLSFRYLKGNTTFIRVKGGNLRENIKNWRILVTKRFEKGTYPGLIINDVLPNVTFRFFGIEGGTGSVILSVCVFSLRGNVNFLERLLKNEYFQIFLFCVPIILIFVVIFIKRYKNKMKEKKKDENKNKKKSESKNLTSPEEQKAQRKITSKELIEKKEIQTKKENKLKKIETKKESEIKNEEIPEVDKTEDYQKEFETQEQAL